MEEEQTSTSALLTNPEVKTSEVNEQTNTVNKHEISYIINLITNFMKLLKTQQSQDGVSQLL